MEPGYIKLKPIKPAIAGYIRSSQNLLKRPDVSYSKRIHDIRVLMKKSRSVLKLTVNYPDNPYFERDMGELRQVGKILCCWRDTSVRRKILKSLKKKNPELFLVLQDYSKLTLLLEKNESEEANTDDKTAALNQVGNLLEKTGARFRFLTLNNIDPHILLRELEVCFLRVQDIYLKCRNNPKPAELHRLRQKAKDFLYQLYIFRPLNPVLIKTLEKRVDNMTQNLGKYNDLHQIILALDYKYKAEARLPALDELILIIRDMQDKYLAKVWLSAGKVFRPGSNLVNILGYKLLVI